MSQIRVDEITDEVGTGSPAFPNKIPSGSMPSGSVIQVVSTTKTDTFSSTNSAVFTDITGLNLSITPLSASSKILVTSVVHASASTDANSQPQVLQLRLLRDGSPINIGDASGSITQATSSVQSTRRVINLGPANFPFPTNFLDEPNTTGTITYNYQIRTDSTGGVTAFVNRERGESNNNDSARVASTITLMEIAG